MTYYTFTLYKRNANPANHLLRKIKGDTVGYSFQWQKCPTLTVIYSISVRIMTVIDSQRLGCLTDVFERRNGVFRLPMTMPCSKQKWEIALHHLWQGLPEGGLEKSYKSSISRLSLKLFQYKGERWQLSITGLL